ncbi:MAG: hypothetical protein ACRC0N_05755, partial [Acinetobacter johnsonii]
MSKLDMLGQLPCFAYPASSFAGFVLGMYTLDSKPLQYVALQAPFDGLRTDQTGLRNQLIYSFLFILIQPKIINQLPTLLVSKF